MKIKNWKIISKNTCVFTEKIRFFFLNKYYIFNIFLLLLLIYRIVINRVKLIVWDLLFKIK